MYCVTQENKAPTPSICLLRVSRHCKLTYNTIKMSLKVLSKNRIVKKKNKKTSITVLFVYSRVLEKNKRLAMADCLRYKFRKIRKWSVWIRRRL